MTEICGKTLVEPRGVEPLTSTLPVLGLLDKSSFRDATNEEHMRTEQEMKQLSVPSGPKDRLAFQLSAIIAAMGGK